MKFPLTSNQQEIYEFLSGYIAKVGFPPTRQEIADGFGFKSANSAVGYLLALEKKGWIRTVPHASRGIVLL